MSFRRRLAVIAASSLLLAGCAVPGQGAAPGVAAEVDGTTLTVADLDALAQEWSDASDGIVTPHRQELATFAAIGPAALAQAEALAEEQGSDLGVTPAAVRTVAEQWLTSAGAVDPDVSDDVVQSLTDMIGIYMLASYDPTFAALADLSEGVEAAGAFSPRLGEYSTDALVTSLEGAAANAQAAGWAAFMTVSAFQPTSAPWAARD